MNPDVVTAIARLRADKVLGSAQAALFDRVARHELVSVRFEIRALLLVERGPLAERGLRLRPPPGPAPPRLDLAYVEVEFYAAINVFSLDGERPENLLRFGAMRAAPSWQGLFMRSAFATTALPLAVLTWGARSRRMFVLDTGIVLAAVSLVTLRQYVHLAPLWAILTLSGAALVVLTLAVERALRHAPGGAIAGFTADPLFADERRQQAPQIVPVVAGFTAPAAVPEEKGFGGDGGRFGGGGAEEKF